MFLSGILTGSVCHGPNGALPRPRGTIGGAVGIGR